VKTSSDVAADETLLKEAVADGKERREAYAGLSAPAVHHKLEKVLLIDDDRDFLELAERVLLKEGFSPVATDAPQSALQIARTVKPVAIFLDVLMPDMNGWEVLKSLQSDPATAQIPVVIMSVLDDQATARDNGAAALVTKPLDNGKLKSALKAARDWRPDTNKARPVALAS
jgi:CheY-like chemotaxis protein